MLKNLNSLKQDMVNKGWTISSFMFTYKKTDYIVLVKRFVAPEKRSNQYALVKLHFMKATDLNYDLIAEANSQGLLISAKELREYFHIEYTENLGDVLKQFTERFGKTIPCSVSNNPSDEEKMAMVLSLNKSDAEDPRKIYCTGVRRNPEGQKRSDFNADKTKLLCPDLYKHFCNETSISFCFSADVSEEKDGATILRNFSNKRY